MQIFWTRQPFKLSAVEYDAPVTYSLLSPTAADQAMGEFSADRLYCSVPSHIRELRLLLKQQQADSLVVLPAPPAGRIVSHPDFPVQLGFNPNAHPEFIPLEQQLRAFTAQPVIRIAVLGMGVQLGDSLVFSTALRYLREVVGARTRCELHLFQRVEKKHHTLFTSLFPELSLGQLPVTVQQLTAFDGYIDLENMLVRPDFNKLPMIDFFLRSFGIPPETVAAGHKSNHWMAPRIAQTCPHLIPKPYIYINLKTSTPLRSIPDKIQKQLIALLRDRFGVSLVVHDLPPAEVSEQCIRGNDLSPDTAAFFQLIRQADAVICADSASLHVADIFNTPTFALFTTISPKQRAAYYPAVTTFSFDMPAELKGRHRLSRDADATVLSEYWQQYGGEHTRLEAALSAFIQRQLSGGH